VSDVGEIVGEPVLFLKSFLCEEEFINGDIMLSRLAKMGSCAGQMHAEYVIYHSELIPVQWQDYRLIFAGTIWQCKENGQLHIPFMFFEDNYKWRLEFDPLDTFWGYGEDGVLDMVVFFD